MYGRHSKRLIQKHSSKPPLSLALVSTTIYSAFSLSSGETASKAGDIIKTEISPVSRFPRCAQRARRLNRDVGVCCFGQKRRKLSQWKINVARPAFSFTQSNFKRSGEHEMV